MTTERLPPSKPLAVVVGLILLSASACDPIVCPPLTTCFLMGDCGEPPNVVFGRCYIGTEDPYQTGPLATRIVDVPSCETGAPLPIRIIAPQSPGTYAVIVFQHGFLLPNNLYDQLLTHVASHGFVVVVPQMYTPGDLSTSKPVVAQIESARAVRVLDWLPDHLSTYAGVTANTNALGLAGHSRGGKIAWQVLIQDCSRAKAVAGVDPTDGTGVPPLSEPRTIEGPLNFPFPTLVIGAGLGSTPEYPFGMACSPQGDNHVQFYDASASPAWHVVVPEGAHLDLLNDDLSTCAIICNICTVGSNRAAMRRLTAGLLVAFFRGSLQGDINAFGYLTDAQAAPMPIEVESR